MKTIKQIKLFISCPGDIVDEIKSIEYIIDEINKTAGRQNGYMLELLDWRNDTYTDIGTDAQEVINSQLENQYDILVGLMWTKAGTPTKRDKSGTIEEINRAIKNPLKEQLIYFRTSSVENIYEINLDQLGILRDFKSKLSSAGVLYKEYNSIESFEALFRINLTNLIIDKVLNSQLADNEFAKSLEAISVEEVRYSNIYNLISEVESRSEEDYDIDVFSLIDDAISYLRNITFSLDSMTNSFGFFSEVLVKRTAEINRYNNIRDTMLKKNKVMVSINHMADELIEFNRRIDEELPSYSENFKLVGKSYSQILLISSKSSVDIIDLKHNIKAFRDSVKYAIDEGANLLTTIVDFPLVNSKFNNSKRQTEISIKNMIKETLNGLLLLDELTDD